MAIALDSIPRFSAGEALAAAGELFGISGSASRLPSERDQNFLITDARGGKLVLKISNREDRAELLDFQHQAMRRVAGARCGVRVPRIVPALEGGDIAQLAGRNGATHCVRLLGWVEGTVLAECAPRGAPLSESIGSRMAQVDLALQDFTHPAMHRVLQWDLRHAQLARPEAALLPRRWRAWVRSVFAQWDEIDWSNLRQGVIHGDANDHNVLVERGQMCGLLDFGDAVRSAIVCELAVALAYAMLRESAPLEAAAHVIRGYHRYNPLTEPERLALYPLIRARLATSLCYAAHNEARNAGDTYQTVTERPARELIERLESCPPEAAPTMIRTACEQVSCAR
jgi:Ser/Thr protein kinase RdoA (MazF antagonist)